jgi:hypothetical protein
MKKQNFVMFCVLVVLVLGFIGCDNGTTDGNTTTKFEGTWIKGTYKIVISGNGYTIQVNDSNYAKGVFSYADTTFTCTDTHRWNTNVWEAGTHNPVTFNYILNGNTLSLADGIGSTENFNGDWNRQ